MHIDLSATSQIAGLQGACLVDSESGLALATHGNGKLDMEAVAALYTQVLRAQLAAGDALGLEDRPEEMLFTTRQHLHLLRPLEQSPSVFLFVALERVPDQRP